MEIGAAIEYVEGHIDYSTWAARSGRTGNVDLSLDRMRRFVELLGNPQATLPVIHVTGTNGKGSTSRIITRLLMAEGMRVGTYSSPHLAKYNERFRIDDVDIDDGSLAALLTAMEAAEHVLGDRLMPFEVLTGAAYTWFAEQQIDVAVVEVGVLGRFDATNVADGRVAVITNVGFDHTSGEGDWRMRVAAEKAGIVKPGAHVILGAIEPRLEQVFRDQLPSQVWRLGEDIVIESDAASHSGRVLSVTTPMQRLNDLALPLHGAHQSSNCALAVAAACAFRRRALPPEHVASALAQVRMPARLETVIERPLVIVDGAHNPDAASALAQSLADDIACSGRKTLIIGLLTGRDPELMLGTLEAAKYDRVIACTPPTPRARAASELAAVAIALGCAASAIDDIGDALHAALATASADDLIVVTGSIYLAADARAWLTRRSNG